MGRNDIYILFAKCSAFIFWYNSSDCINFDELAERLEHLAERAKEVARNHSNENSPVCKDQPDRD